MDQGNHRRLKWVEHFLALGNLPPRKGASTPPLRAPTGVPAREQECDDEDGGTSLLGVIPIAEASNVNDSPLPDTNNANTQRGG